MIIANVIIIASVSAAAPCVDSGPEATECATEGGVVLTVTGTNMGSDASLLSVEVGNNDCANVAITTAETTVTCTLPAGTGLGNFVKVLSQACPGNVGATGLLSYGKPTVTRIEMPAGTCSVTTGTACDNDSDCPAGTCSVTTATTCHKDGDCPASQTCGGGGEHCTAACCQVRLGFCKNRG